MDMRLFALFLLLGLSSACAGEEKLAPAEVKTLTLVTYNVYERPMEEEKRIPALLRLLEESKADLIALQESHPWFMERLQKEAWAKTYQVAQPKTKHGAPCELCVLSKFPLDQVEYLELPGRLGRGALVISRPAPWLDRAPSRTRRAAGWTGFWCAPRPGSQPLSRSLATGQSLQMLRPFFHPTISALKQF